LTVRFIKINSKSLLMTFTEQDALKIIGEATECNNLDVLINMLNGINPKILSDAKKKEKLIEALNDLRQNRDVDKCHQLLMQIVQVVIPSNLAFVNLKCSTIFTKNFNSLSNRDQTKAINIINGIVHEPLNRSIPIGDFIETPHATHNPIRVFWFRDGNSLFIVDIYCKNDLDAFYSKIRNGRITKANYTSFVDLKSIIVLR